jgi:outer membrane protein OmpA-like peptidoglycan-associated protein
MKFKALTCALLLAALAGCRTYVAPPPPAKPTPRPVPVVPPTVETIPPKPTETPPPQRYSNLSTEQLRLADLFRGTPVVITRQDDASMRVAVPLRFCFDVGDTKIKPPLAAVLDKLAKSQQTEPTVFRITAMDDGKAASVAAFSAPPLGHNRALSIRDYLVNQGIEVKRMGVSNSAKSAGVVMVVSDMAPR